MVVWPSAYTFALMLHTNKMFFQAVGRVCFDCHGTVFGFFSKKTPANLLVIIKIGDKETAALELAMIAISMAAHLWKTLITSHGVVLFAATKLPAF